MVAKYKREIGFILGIAVLLMIWLMPTPPGLKVEGQKCLAFSLLAVIWWAMGVTHPGYTSLLLLMSYVLFKVAPPEVVFRLWTTPLIYLVVGGFLIATAVQASGLGKRIAYSFIVRYVSSFASVIIAGYVLGFLLSFFIPHPWPRSFLIMSVMAFIIKAAELSPKDSANIGLAVFAGSASNSMILLTGDSVLNIAAVGFSGSALSWLGWLYYMGVPGVAATLLTCFLQLKLFTPGGQFSLDKDVIQTQLKELGPLSHKEKVVLFWVVLAIVLWATDSIHHIHPGWIALGGAIGLSLPKIGDILKPPDWNTVNIGTLFFLTAALAIGTVGAATGMNTWVASVILPAQVPTNPFIFAALVSAVTVVLHMILGSALAVMGIVAPTLVGYAAAAGWSPLVPALLVYTAVAMHWVLPFHHMNILVGVGEAGGKYSDSEVARLGIPLTVVVFIITMLVQVPWWKVTGLL